MPLIASNNGNIGKMSMCNGLGMYGLYIIYIIGTTFISLRNSIRASSLYPYIYIYISPARLIKIPSSKYVSLLGSETSLKNTRIAKPFKCNSDIEADLQCGVLNSDLLWIKKHTVVKYSILRFIGESRPVCRCTVVHKYKSLSGIFINRGSTYIFGLRCLCQVCKWSQFTIGSESTQRCE